MLRISRPDIPSDHIVQYSVSERFIKLPIENYLRLLKDPEGNPIEAIAPQIALINAINNPNYRFVTAALSRRTGKTFISNVIAQLAAYVPGTNILIMAPNYSLSNISWEIQRSFLNKFEVELVRANAKDKILELKNGSTIRMGSVGQADSVVGRSYDLILFDEAALDDRGIDAFNIQLRPTLDKMNSKAIFISTPRGKNWFWEFFMRGFNEDDDEWVSIHSDWKENPRAKQKDIDQAKRNMSSAEFSQEYEADFVVLQGKIWDFKTECIVDIEPEKLKVWDVIAGLDVGFRDATAFCVILTDGEKYYVVDEYQSSTKTTAGHAKKIKKLINKWNIDFVYIDSAAQQTKYDFAMNYDISTINATKSRLDGIGYVASIVEHDRLMVDPKCKDVIASLDNYVWDDREGLLNEKPKHNGYQHMADALRYALYSHSYNMEVL